MKRNKRKAEMTKLELRVCTTQLNKRVTTKQFN